MKTKLLTAFLLLILSSTQGLAQRPSIGGLVGGLSPNSGMYANRIPVLTHQRAFTEICFKNGQVLWDLNSAGDSTEGGECVPNDVGWVIEQDERLTQPWELAKAECLQSGMRLPEVFEWKYSCKNAAAFNLNTMTGNWEWASNIAAPLITGSVHGPVVPMLGNISCLTGGLGWASNTGDFESSLNFRCAK